MTDTQHDSRSSRGSPQLNDDDYLRFLRGEPVHEFGGGMSGHGAPPQEGRRRRREDGATPSPMAGFLDVVQPPSGTTAPAPPTRRGRHAAPDEDSPGTRWEPSTTALPPVAPAARTPPMPATPGPAPLGWAQADPWRPDPLPPAPLQVPDRTTAPAAWPDPDVPPPSLPPYPNPSTDLDEPTDLIDSDQYLLAYPESRTGTFDLSGATVNGATRAATRVTRRPPPRKRQRWLRILAWSGAFLGVAVLAFGGYAFYEYRKISRNIHRVDALNTRDPAIKDAAKQLNAENFLLIGSDTRAGANERYGGTQVEGQRSDTTILAHLSPDRQHATLISFPRDAWVSIPDCTATNGTVIPGHDGMFNSAFETGGPNCTVRMLQRLTGISITHYVQVDFTGFKSMVDALGGIPVCSTESVYDHDSGLRLHKGQQVLHGEQALAFVRARHGLGDGSDLDRIKRQQMFLGSMMRVATSNRILFNPVQLTRFLEAASKSVTLDRQTTLNDLRLLAGQLKGLDPRRVTFLTAPIANRDYDPTGQRATGGGRVLLDAQQGELLWQSLINDKAAAKPGTSAAGRRPGTTSVTVPPAQVTVRVLNGVGTPGLAGRVSTALAAQGFSVGTAANAAGGATSVIRYAPTNRAAAITLLAAVPGATLTADESLGRALVLVVGDNYHGVQHVQVGQQVTVPPAAAAAVAPSSPSPARSPQASINAGDTNLCA